MCAAWTEESVMMVERDLRPAACRRVRSGKKSPADSCRPCDGQPAVLPSVEDISLLVISPSSFSLCMEEGDDTGGVGYTWGISVELLTHGTPRPPGAKTCAARSTEPCASCCGELGAVGSEVAVAISQRSSSGVGPVMLCSTAGMASAQRSELLGLVVNLLPTWPKYPCIIPGSRLSDGSGRGVAAPDGVTLVEPM